MNTLNSILHLLNTDSPQKCLVQQVVRNEILRGNAI